ncbi:MAG: ABC-F family ATP-binding cassette domain-containing protein [Acidobacteria bacterium]|nr:ABC-F family ATP-binding cassette domain-containing protein [Acidobacteriota bacterium]
MAILIDLQNVSVEGAERTILKGLSLTISSGDRLGVVGINGAGKSTLLKLIAGTLTPDGGQIRRAKTLHVGYLEQIPDLPQGSVRHALGSGWEIDAALDRLGMFDAVDLATDELSGGQRKRVALARLFSRAHDVVILDEPTNHLDLNAISWLENQITNFRGAVVLVSHDRFLLDQVTTRMVEIDRGTTYVHAGGYARLLEAQAEREAQSQQAEQVRRNLARTELAWLRRGVKARSTKPQARIDAAHRLLSTRAAAAARDGSLDFMVATPRLGNTVIKAHQVSYAYRESTLVVRDVSLELGPGDRVGIVGSNGAGKSTFVNLLAQRMAPTSGTLKHGPTVVAAHFEQGDGDLDLDLTVQELVAGPQGIPGSLADVALMKRFWFTGALPKSKARELSGGERRRLQLLLALAQRPNVLFLDEPTNDLDLETIRLLEDFLSQWPGTLVVVSHDRTFLSRTTDRLLEVHPDGAIKDIPGGIDAWIARAAGLAPSPAPGGGPAPAVPTPSNVSRGRLLRDAEKDMTRLERRRATLSDKIATSSDYLEQAKWGAELEKVLKDLAVAEEHWLTLAD